MPELPDLTIYLEGLHRFVKGQRLEAIRLSSPFVLRSISPSPSEVEGRLVVALHRMGKRIVFELEQEAFVVIHLMIAGRFQWKEHRTPIPAKIGLAAFDFPHGSLLLTEAGTKKRASLHLVGSREALREFDRGGIEVFDCTLEQFRGALLREHHTVKRSLTDPRLFSAMGNAYSDEILHRARLSPLKQTKHLKEEEIERLFAATKQTMSEWIERLRAETGNGFPSKVTAFRPEMAVHGKFGKPCPVCGAPIQRIVYAENECNYCARCQTEGKLLSDRSLSRLLKDDWPKTIDELESGTRRRQGSDV